MVPFSTGSVGSGSLSGRVYFEIVRLEEMSGTDTWPMCAAETLQVSAVETEQVSAVGTRWSSYPGLPSKDWSCFSQTNAILTPGPSWVRLPYETAGPDPAASCAFEESVRSDLAWRSL